MMQSEWREILHETILYELLFKAVAKDMEKLKQANFKMSYCKTLDAISRWAERKHHEYRSNFGRMGGKIHQQKTTDGFIYIVTVTFRGRQEESVYNVEILKAECQVRLNNCPILIKAESK
ncbi:hypothetical protein ACFYU8_17985 [Brevibacillus sp. NPDC003359]|uniref:hypothetical protein n=1 Tax=unclassified Brevibacillus TaxID=2684853 RepID=UPI0036C0671A